MDKAVGTMWEPGELSTKGTTSIYHRSTNYILDITLDAKMMEDNDKL